MATKAIRPLNVTIRPLVEGILAQMGNKPNWNGKAHRALIRKLATKAAIGKEELDNEEFTLLFTSEPLCEQANFKKRLQAVGLVPLEAAVEVGEEYE